MYKSFLQIQPVIMKATVMLLVTGYFLHSAVSASFEETLKDIKEEILKTTKICFLQTNTTHRDMIQFYKDVKRRNILNNTKCFISCMMQAFKVMDDKGNIDMNQLKKNIHLIHSDSLRTAVINDLNDMVKDSNAGTDPCERAFLFVTAGYNTLMENKEVQAMITTAKSMAGEFMESYFSEVLADN